ncbi:hypothetical protein POJ06DRAFT_6330 [Lipomyces tetrasporus]|uniref:BAG domain-containing protein n=1 Tax=Lipomyces tetrasporus TaxID=54092 RepID=A0AAD7R101_9ASCO|nr:uncharacterized protein POJ06DRAFT_6330 [Lipomyces tetrasporus]KAJ8103742.1 hypothetical protein POJ06DRAFT_6330 [Lipomyces tetrasporus]
MERVYYVQSPAQRQSPTAAIAVHRAHLSHYISQLSALEREQQRLALEQQLLARQQAQLAAKRDQLTYLIAEEQDLVLRAIQQQQQKQREEEEAALAAALAEREALVARRQRLRYAVYRKQQEEKALEDAEIERVLQLVQQQAQRSETTSPRQSGAFAQIKQQQQDHATPYWSDLEQEETGVRPGSISAFLRQQGIKPHGLYSPYATLHSSRKRGSRRGGQQSTAAPIPRLLAQEQAKATSSKLVPDVNYASAQGFLSALFGGLEHTQSEAQERGPKPTQSELDKSPMNQFSEDELARILFGSEESADIPASVPEVYEPPARQESTSRPPFHYTLSRSSIPRTTSQQSFVISSALEIVGNQIGALRERVTKAASRIDTIPTDLPESKRRQAFLDVQVELERCYSDLDDIIISPAEGEEDNDETKEQRQQLRLQKHAVTTLAVDAADRIDKILSPASPSDSETEEEEYEIVHTLPAGMAGGDIPIVKGANILKGSEISSPFNQADLGTSSSSSSESTSVFGSEMPTPESQTKKSAPAPAKINDDGEFYMLEKPSAEESSVILEDVVEERDETLYQEEMNQIKVYLTPVPNVPANSFVSSTGMSTPSTRDEDDSSVIVTASTPVIHDDAADEIFVPESGDKSGQVVLEKNTGQEKEEFLDSEEKGEEKISLSAKDGRKSVVDKVKSEARSRSPSPLRHVVLEDVPDDE